MAQPGVLSVHPLAVGWLRASGVCAGSGGHGWSVLSKHFLACGFALCPPGTAALGTHPPRPKEGRQRGLRLRVSSSICCCSILSSHSSNSSGSSNPCSGVYFLLYLVPRYGGMWADKAAYSGIQRDTAGYSGIQRDAAGYSGIQRDAAGYSGIQRDTVGYSGIPYKKFFRARV